MQYDPFRSSRDLGLTWPEVKLWPWPFKVILYMVRRALTRQTQWYQIRCSTFKINDVIERCLSFFSILEKPFWKILEFWPLVTSILTWAKKWPKWFRNDFSRAFERCLSFFPTATRSRDHGGRSNAPPPPSRRWKIQRPSRARVNSRYQLLIFFLQQLFFISFVITCLFFFLLSLYLIYCLGLLLVGGRTGWRLVKMKLCYQWSHVALRAFTLVQYKTLEFPCLICTAVSEITILWDIDSLTAVILVGVCGITVCWHLVPGVCKCMCMNVCICITMECAYCTPLCMLFGRY